MTAPEHLVRRSELRWPAGVGFEAWPKDAVVEHWA